MFAIASITTATQEIKRSRFLATAAPVTTIEDANHNCWAWRIGQSYRFNDDGEPSGTAGKPILQAIDGLELDRVAVVVTRWFGGTLLGSGGLIRAYGGTAAICLQAAERHELVPTISITISVSFSDLALVKSRLVAQSGIQISAESFTASGAILDATVAISVADHVSTMVTDLTSGRAIIKLT